ncbi:MAG: hypothetical protein FOGNACKC_02219 [Anaerolineae bacterium]|nr:hypothetical protein [Anaerolineae bacterium]
MSKPLIEIVKHIRETETSLARQSIADVAANSGDGYNVKYLEYTIEFYVNVNEGWIKPLNLNPSVGQLVTFYERGSDEVDRIWPKMAGLYFVLVDRSTKWTKYQLFEFAAYTGDVKVPRSGETPAYRYLIFTAYCRATQGGGFAFGNQIYLKLPDLTGRTVGTVSFPMATPDTFAVTARVDGHLITINAEDHSLLRPGFYHWQVEQADDGSGTNAQTLIYGPGDLPALVGISPGVTKYYRVRSVSILGDLSAWTAYTSAVYNVVPALPTWVSHTYRLDGHFVTWSHPLPSSVNYFTMYRNTSASASGATVVGTAPRDSTSYLIPYAAGGNYFGLKAVGYAGTDAGIAWFGPYNLTPTTPVQTVNKTVINWLVTWPLISNAVSYEVQGATSSGGAGAKLVATIPQPVGVTTVAAQITREAGYSYFRVRALGWDGSASSYSAWATDTNAPATPTLSKVTEDNNQVTIFLSTADTSHTAAGFSHYIVQRADNASGTNTTTVDSAAPYAPALTYPVSLTGTVKYYRLTAVDVAGNQSAASSWMASVYSREPSVKDYFDGYGGTATSPLESLYWLQIAAMEDYETWGAGTLVTSDAGVYPVEGAKMVKVNASASTAPFPNAYRSGVLDLSQDGRFTNNDYITVWWTQTALEAPTSSGVNAGISFVDSALKRAYVTLPSSGYVAVKRSDFTVESGFNWSNIINWGVWFHELTSPPLTGPTAATAVFDDLRIVKADPSNATTYNDTGGVWQATMIATSEPNSGEWHIYPGNRSGEPAKPFSVGQIIEHNYHSLYYVKNSSITTGTVQVGLHKKTTGYAGIAFFISDTTLNSFDMYIVWVSGTALEIRRFVNGGGYYPPQVTVTLPATSEGKMFWLGVDLREYTSDPGRLKVYTSETEGNLIQASNLRISWKDPTPITPSGKVGVITWSSIARFFDFTAGSPAHAEVADLSKTVDGPMVDGVDGSKRVFFSAASHELMYSTDRTTWWYSRNHFNWTTVLDDFVSGANYCSYDPALWAGWQTDSGFSTPLTVTSRRSLLSPYWSSGTNTAAFLKYIWTVPGTPGYSAFPFKAVVPGFAGANVNGSYAGLYLDDYNGSVRTNWIAYVLRYNTGPVMELVRINNGTATVMKTFNDWFGDFSLFWTSFSSAWSSWTMSLYFSTHNLFQVPTGSSITGLTWTPTRGGLVFYVNGSATSGTIFAVDFVGNP